MQIEQAMASVHEAVKKRSEVYASWSTLTKLILLKSVSPQDLALSWSGVPALYQKARTKK